MVALTACQHRVRSGPGSVQHTSSRRRPGSTPRPLVPLTSGSQPSAGRRVRLAPRRAAAVEAAAVIFAGDDAEQDLAKAFDRLRPGLPVGGGNANPLRFGKSALQLVAA